MIFNYFQGSLCIEFLKKKLKDHDKDYKFFVACENLSKSLYLTTAFTNFHSHLKCLPATVSFLHVNVSLTVEYKPLTCFKGFVLYLKSYPFSEKDGNEGNFYTL